MILTCVIWVHLVFNIILPYKFDFCVRLHMNIIIIIITQRCSNERMEGELNYKRIFVRDGGNQSRNGEFLFYSSVESRICSRFSSGLFFSSFCSFVANFDGFGFIFDSIIWTTSLYFMLENNNE